MLLLNIQDHLLIIFGCLGRHYIHYKLHAWCFESYFVSTVSIIFDRFAYFSTVLIIVKLIFVGVSLSDCLCVLLESADIQSYDPEPAVQLWVTDCQRKLSYKRIKTSVRKRLYRLPVNQAKINQRFRGL